MNGKWLAIVGMGEDGLDGLSPVARSLIDGAELLVGSARHLARIPADGRTRLAWRSPLSAVVDDVLARRGRPAAILATGDPMHYGIGVTLARRVPIDELTIVPSPSAFSLACARLGWPLAEVDPVTLHGRPIELLQPWLQPGARILALSGGGDTPAAVAGLLRARGYGSSRITVLERMGGADERMVTALADDWQANDIAELNLVAIDCVADRGAALLPRVPGLPDTAFHHDGQLTKREVRALTLAALAPVPGQTLWDVGAGAGSIAIEWMRAAPRARAIAIERLATRRRFIADNAAALGVPGLEIVAGEAPSALAGLARPDAAFIGGGVAIPGLIDHCWHALPVGGRLVANAVSVDGEAAFAAWQARNGGTLTRVAVSRAEPLGTRMGWRALAPVTQLCAVKP